MAHSAKAMMMGGGGDGDDDDDDDDDDNDVGSTIWAYLISPNCLQ